MRNLVIKIKLSKKLEGTMSENEKDDDIFSEKEKQKSLRLLADYQNLEKQTIDRIMHEVTR